MIEGVIHHCTEMEVDRQYVDSHGQSTIAFAFCRLLGFLLLLSTLAAILFGTLPAIVLSRPDLSTSLRQGGRVAAGGYRNRAFEEEVGYEAVTTDRLQAHIDAHLRELPEHGGECRRAAAYRSRRRDHRTTRRADAP